MKFLRTEAFNFSEWRTLGYKPAYGDDRDIKWEESGAAHYAMEDKQNMTLVFTIDDNLKPGMNAKVNAMPIPGPAVNNTMSMELTVHQAPVPAPPVQTAPATAPAARIVPKLVQEPTAAAFQRPRPLQHLAGLSAGDILLPTAPGGTNGAPAGNYVINIK